jgi:hypothetical protein
MRVNQAQCRIRNNACIARQESPAHVFARDQNAARRVNSVVQAQALGHAIRRCGKLIRSRPVGVNGFDCGLK